MRMLSADLAHLDDPNRCPECFNVLTPGAPVCGSCRLSLTSPLLLDVWRLSTEVTDRLRRRESVLDQIRLTPAGQPSAQPASAHGPVPAPAPAAPAAPAPAAPGTFTPGTTGPFVPGPFAPGAPLTPASQPVQSPAAFQPFSFEPFPVSTRPKRDAAPISVRTFLLGLGVVLLGIAAIIFTVVAWSRIGIGGKAAILAAITLASGAASRYFVQRALPATAEALAALTAGLVLLDAYAFDATLEPDLSTPVYWAIVTAAMAAGAYIVARRTELLTPSIVAAIAGQLPLMLLAAEYGAAAWALLMAVQAGVLAEIVWRLRAPSRQAPLALCCIGLAGASAIALASSLTITGGLTTVAPEVGCLALLLLGVAAGLLAYRHAALAPLRDVAAAACAGLVVLAAFTLLLNNGLSAEWAPAAAAGLVVALFAGLVALPMLWRTGPAVTGVLVLGAVAFAELPNLVLFAFGPVTWWVDAWTVPSTAIASNVLTTGGVEFPLAATATMAVLALAAVALARALPAYRTPALVAGAIPTLITLATLPLLTYLPHVCAVAWLLLLAGAALATPQSVRLPSWATTSAGLALLAAAVSWSMAARSSTLLALGVGALVAAAGAARRRGYERALLTIVAVGLTVAEAAAATLTLDAELALATTWHGALLAAFVAAVTAGVLVAALPPVLPRAAQLGVEAGGAAAFTLATLVTAPDTLALGWALLVSTLAAALVTVRRDRRELLVVPAALACLTAAVLSAGYGLDARAITVISAAVALATVLVGTYALRHQPRADLVEAVGVAAYVLAATGGLSADVAEVWLGWLVLAGAAVGAIVTVRTDRRLVAIPTAALTCAAGPLLAYGFGANDEITLLVAALVAGAVTVFGTHLWRSQPGDIAVEGVGVAAYLLAVLAGFGGDVAPLWLGWSVLAAAAAGAVVTIRPDRRLVAVPTAALTCAAAPLLAYGLGTEDEIMLLVSALVAAAVAVFGTHVWRGQPGDSAVEGVGGAAYALTLLVTAAAAIDLSWLALILTIGGVMTAAIAVRPDRRKFTIATGVLLTGALWARLADSDITAVEAYTVPPALALLVIGFVQRRSHPETSSWAAYRNGLVLALVPSLLASLGDDTLTRPLLLGAAALLVTLLGARERLQAPLAVGGAVLLVDAFAQLLPYSEVARSWAGIGAAGILLLFVGSTYERRLRDLQQLREKYDSLA